MIQNNAGRSLTDNSLAPYGEEGSGMAQRLDSFAADLMNPGALSEPFSGGHGRGGKAGKARGRPMGPEQEEYGNKIGKKPPKPKSSRGGGSLVGGQGNANPGGIYTPNPDI